jgi:hypothetical protein
VSVAADATEVNPVENKAPAKPKKAPAKPLAQLMEEDVIPSLKATLEAQDDITELELSFTDNRVSIPSCFFDVFLPKMSAINLSIGILKIPVGRLLSTEGHSLFILGILP